MKKFYFFCLFILLLNEGFAQVTETFEAGTKTAYASADVTSTLYKWNLNEALLGTSASDRKNNSQSVRIRNTGKLTMVQSKASGLGVLSINHANYGSDLNATWKVEVSDDGGGFDVQEQLAEGNGAGLRNMVRRAALANLICNISSSRGKGSTFTLEQKQ